MWQKLHYVLLLLAAVFLITICAHDAKDFDDSILYQIDFEMPDFDKNPDLKNHLKTFYTHEHEKYDCVIPVLDEPKDEPKTDPLEITPINLLHSLFTSCSFRIEAYWSYEICHGKHVRQYHEEREGKVTKFQEYYLGQWSKEKTEQLINQWYKYRDAGIKYKTIKIENTKYPYFEIVMSDGTVCDITKAPRTTVVRYICSPPGKNAIYSFKETWSCNYEAIVLTSVLCIIPGFKPKESKELSIKCFNSPTQPHKPLSMLRQELSDLQSTDADIPVSREANMLAAAIARSNSAGERYVFLDKVTNNVDKLVLEIMSDAGEVAATGAEGESSAESDSASSVANPQISETESSTAEAVNTPINVIGSDKNCLTVGAGWWRYEFCYGRYVRQFHKDKNGENEIYLGYFSAAAHREWLALNPEKLPKNQGRTLTIWHHYGQGTICDRTAQPREVDVKLTCEPSTSATAVSMYLLEPTTCKYVLALQSPIVCDILPLVDQYGVVNEGNFWLIQEVLKGAAEYKADKKVVKKKIDEQLDGIMTKENGDQQKSQYSKTVDDLNDEAET